jgi:hypothetical protein
MVILEFRRLEAFQDAASTLEGIKVPFHAEVSDVDFRPHRVWLFPEDFRSPDQQKALARVRLLEKKDRVRSAAMALPNLADPL